ncbi:universal stress protein [Sneathiella marina]|uniref:Universal stress protein n=1 Tax=Sneathiella marina TaxID=2950108 RepID=A0ABY4W096_9PROT|nr:universal stress protein [Sneathiella marina]USG60627.1 universal stress protein [Sneathiella marina]
MYKHILLAVDLDDERQRSVEVAVEYAKAFGSTLHVMTVLPNFGMSMVGSFFPKDHEKQMLEQSTKALHGFVKANIPDEIAVQHIVGLGSVYEEVLRVSEEISSDLIVIGTHRPDMKDYLLGPNAARVSRHAKCSVLIVRES